MAICSRCGGSGIQRVSDQRFRTCLDCLGHGDGQRLEVGQESLRFPPGELGMTEAFSAAVSASAAK